MGSPGFKLCLLPGRLHTAVLLRLTVVQSDSLWACDCQGAAGDAGPGNSVAALQRDSAG